MIVIAPDLIAFSFDSWTTIKRCPYCRQGDFMFEEELGGSVHNSNIWVGVLLNDFS